ncbi:MAG: cytochrome b/b6 domain-containing protein [Acidobacteriota bacterium]
MAKRSLDEFVPRFSWWTRLQHAIVILMFGLLMLTGLPQKWPQLGASQWVVDAIGGIFVARWWHRAAGWFFTFFLFVHLVAIIWGVATRRMRPTMLLAKQDFLDAIHSLRYYLGRSETAPRFGRYDYRQKFEYWGLIFGSLIMAISGIILFFPILISQWLPAELIPAAKALHSNEALLALAIVLVWHMYGAHLSPEVFPMDTSIFTGKISKRRLKHEHPIEYEQTYGKQ